MIYQPNKYVVIKQEDIDQLSEKDKEMLNFITYKIEQNRIAKGKRIDNRYYIVNQDEPYAEKIYRAIEDGEEAKQDAKVYKDLAELCNKGIPALENVVKLLEQVKALNDKEAK